MRRRINPGNSRRKKPETVETQSDELIDKVPDNGINAGRAEEPLNREVSGYEYLNYERANKCNKCKHNCEEICCKYNNSDCCNFACASDKELLIRIICLLINKEYGLKAIERKIRNAEEDGDKKNIKSITELLERAIVGLGETAVGAVKKAVDAAGTMTEITHGLANIAAGAAGTAGALALTSSGLANVSAGTALTAGAAASTVHGVAEIPAATVLTAGTVADTVAEAAGLAAAGAATIGVAGDVAAEAAGLAAAGAATIGVAGDVAAEAAGLAAAGAATVGAAAETVAGAAATSAAVSATVAGAAETAAGAAATTAAVSGIVASTAETAAGAAATTAAVSGIVASTAETAAGAAATSAAVSATVAGAAETAAGAAATSAAVSATVAGAAETVAGAAATSAAVSAAVAGAAETAAGAAATTAAISDLNQASNESVGTADDDLYSEAVSVQSVVLDTETDTVQVWVLNNNTEPTGLIEIIMYSLTDNSKTVFYRKSSAVHAKSSVFFTIASIPAAYEVQIKGLRRNIIAYAVSMSSSKESLSLQTPVDAGILLMYP